MAQERKQNRRTPLPSRSSSRCWEKSFSPVPNMPPPLLTFDGINSAQSFCGCIPPDTIGDVGPNHYVETTNTAIKIFDKSGNTLLASVSFDDVVRAAGRDHSLRYRSQTRETLLPSMITSLTAGW